MKLHGQNVLPHILCYYLTMTDTYTILLLEDEAEPAEMLANYLEMHQFKVLHAPDGKKATNLINANASDIDLAILDIMVPGLDGHEVCRFIRNHPVTSSIPVIFLTAKDKEKDEIDGLTVGADDYIPKPASLNLIKAHVESLLRRHRKNSNKGWMAFSNVHINPETREATSSGKLLDLTHTEFEILKMFFESPKRVFTRQEILEHIGGEDKFVFDRTVDVHIKNLRLKMEINGDLIKTYRGTGYGLNKEMLTR